MIFNMTCLFSLSRGKEFPTTPPLVHQQRPLGQKLCKMRTRDHFRNTGVAAARALRSADCAAPAPTPVSPAAAELLA